MPPHTAPEVVLASGSPRRRELLTSLGVTFRVQAADLDERSDQIHPAEVARDLARQKARAVAQASPGAVVIASDTVVALGDVQLAKPASTEENAAFIAQLSARAHHVYSGVAVISPQGEDAEVSETRVVFRALTPGEVQYYARSGEGLDKAGGYGIQGLGAALIERIEGEYSGVVGFPLSLVIKLLRKHGVAIWGEV
ncbi:septum formation protein Maf [Deinococcus irradiatisoli]|uniref:dTTP/UTP pyrophosphatase n=1 Tax=Deinococcus irradiatisoli TaxID=2202254 RepID=A0A2Z3JG60_9DEIO|nr:Maf family nucleotide pyrophosphatase [Deinococcus irradiatisoli]AWN22966.1 septum formation protein Maf [Deinococcus irradiatisoli]